MFYIIGSSDFNACMLLFFQTYLSKYLCLSLQLKHKYEIAVCWWGCFLEQRNDGKQQQHWPACYKTETWELKPCCKSITKAIPAPDKRQGRNLLQAAKSWYQPIFHAVVYENTSCCGLSWTWALTQSTSLHITRALGGVCISMAGEAEAAEMCPHTSLTGVSHSLQKCMICKVNKSYLNYYSSTEITHL